MPSVLNKHTCTASQLTSAIYIGRPSKWGNPFTIGRDGSRPEVCMKYQAWLEARPGLIKEARAELRGKDLLCFCFPQQCHGDLLLYYANSEE